MKNIKNSYKIIVLSLLVSLNSCTKLEDTNYNSLIADEFEPTSSDIAAMVSSAYVDWRNTLLLWNGIWRTQEVTADQVVIPARPNGWVDGGVYKRLHQHNWTAEDDPVNQGWSRTYNGITNCNKIIFQIESGYVPLEDELLATSIAELRVLRASYYYLLLDLYGNVPIVTQFDVPEGFLPEQSTRKEVYDFIVTEITESLEDLSENSGAEMYGRFNKWGAYTLLSKVYLNAEVWSGTPQWQKCIDAAQAVIDSGNYILESNQKSVFVTENQNSKEIIFALAIDDNYTTSWNTFDIHLQTLQPANQATYDLELTPWGGMAAIPQFISSFDPDDSRLTNNFIYGQQYASSGEELKVSLGSFNGDPLNYINEIPSVDRSESIHGYRFGKFEIEMGSSNILNNDFPVFRYADVLMMKAESLLRLGSADAAATIVTQVRERAFRTNPDKAVVTGAELMSGAVYDYGLRNENATTQDNDDITYGRFLDELGWEFNQEGHRRQDLIRFGIFTTKSWLSHEPVGEYRSLYPIPQQALNNNTNLVQNPGY
ncbi:RagB/SusD family nutrient uptake outer membrane protein [Leeuwenhoekiella sp. LLG6367-2.1]|uniref:RagB/SusD family nutrient uptake outer membrane protein n=1 Tax=Leeuwenhoekiella sp. LLG6367-2.1 TaxID=3160833 RepID=UPI003869A4B7